MPSLAARSGPAAKACVDATVRPSTGATTAPIGVRYDCMRFGFAGPRGSSGVWYWIGAGHPTGSGSWPKSRDCSARAAGLGRMPHGAACSRPAWRSARWHWARALRWGSRRRARPYARARRDDVAGCGGDGPAAGRARGPPLRQRRAQHQPALRLYLSRHRRLAPLPARLRRRAGPDAAHEAWRDPEDPAHQRLAAQQGSRGPSSASTTLPVVPAMDQPLVEPEVRRSANGVLSTSLRCAYAYRDIGGMRLYLRAYEGGAGARRCA